MLEGSRSHPVPGTSQRTGSHQPDLPQGNRPLRNELFSKRLELREFLTDPNVKAESIQLKNTEVLALESKIGDREVDYLIKVRSSSPRNSLRTGVPSRSSLSFGDDATA